MVLIRDTGVRVLRVGTEAVADHAISDRSPDSELVVSRNRKPGVGDGR